MRAITVIPGQAGSAALEDVPEPDGGRRRAARRRAGARDLRHRRGDRARRVRLGAAGRGAAGARARVARAGARGAGRARGSRPATSWSASCGGRTRCRAAVRGGRVGLLRERRVHRARDQAAARLRLGALARRAGVRDQARPGAGGRRRAARADQRGGQGVGADRADRRARDVRAAPGARHRRRADRPARRRCWRPSAATRCTCSTRSTDGPKPELVARLGGTYHAARRVGRGPGRHRGRGHGRAGRRRPGAARHRRATGSSA